MSPFLKNVILVLQGTVAAHIIGLAALPFLTRVFSPAAFGVFQASQSVLTIALVSAALRYEIAILTANSTPEVKALLTLGLMLNVATSSIVLILSWLIPIYQTDESVLIRSILSVSPLWLLSAGVLQTFSYLALREQAFHAFAVSKGLQALVFSTAGLFLGYTGFAALGLLLADFLGRIAASTFLFVRCASPYMSSPSSFRRMRIVAWRYRNFPQISLVSALVNTAGAALTPFFLLIYFKSDVVGQYALVDRSVGVAVGVIGQSVSQVFMGSFADSMRQGSERAHQLFRRIIAIQFAIGVLPAIVVAVVLPNLFIFVFGPEWRIAGEFGVIMSPLFLIGFIFAPVNMVLTIMGQQQLQLIWDVTRTAGMILIWVAVGSLGLSAKTAIALHTGFNCLAYLSYLWIADRCITQAGLGTSSGIHGRI